MANYNITELLLRLPAEERLITDVLRQIIQDTLPSYCREKISYGVPYFYGNKGICLIYPASVPRGGFKEGVLLGYWYGNRLIDPDHYLTHGTNKQIFYKIFKSAEEIDDKAIIKLLHEAIELDMQFAKTKSKRSKVSK
ncbi:MAG: DUF1801 domain-containing protein [Bacteroidetes bacterium]|nr:DUF1801 domain-containing protein [Bacteroidota bacterium]